MAKRKNARHPGIELLKPKPPRQAWRARFTDPDSGKVKYVSLDPLALRTEERRRDWAIREAGKLARRRQELKDGAPRYPNKTPQEVVDKFFADNKKLRPRTELAYRSAADKWVAWCKEHKVKTTNNIDHPQIFQFRTSLVNEPRRTAARGEGVGRGKRVVQVGLRKPASVNRDLRSIGTVLSHAVNLGYMPRLTIDQLLRGLKKEDADPVVVTFLSRDEVKQTLRAAIAHDRAAHPSGRPKYQSIAPMVLLTCLTGARFGEMVSLRWERVSLEGTGQITLEPDDTKTKQPRTIHLKVAPSARLLLEVLDPKRERHPFVFTLTAAGARMAERRMRENFGAPKGFGWQALRRTASTYLVNSAIFVSPLHHASRQLGHSVVISERLYTGVELDIDPSLKTLEAVLGVESEAAAIIELAKERLTKERLATG